MHCQRAGTLFLFGPYFVPNSPQFTRTTLTVLQNESVLIQKIYTHFKKAPGSHKLGVLYVVDSVTRQWVDAARKAGQVPGSEAPDGTFAAGVKRVTDLLPVLMTDIINNAPQDQKVSNRLVSDILTSQPWRRPRPFVQSCHILPNIARACTLLNNQLTYYRSVRRRSRSWWTSGSVVAHSRPPC